MFPVCVRASLDNDTLTAVIRLYFKVLLPPVRLRHHRFNSTAPWRPSDLAVGFPGPFATHKVAQTRFSVRLLATPYGSKSLSGCGPVKETFLQVT